MANAAGSVFHAYLENDHTIILLGRDANGRRTVRQAPAEHVAFFKTTDLDEKLQRELRTSVYVRGIRREGDWTRVAFANGIARQDFCMGRRSFVAQLGLNTYEADVSPVLRYVLDNKIKVQAPRRVYLDLETDSRLPFSRKEEMRVLSWALVDEDERVQVGVLEENNDRAERKLLGDLWKALEAYDQISAWNGDGFDFPVLFSRSDARGLEVNANRWLWLDHMVLFRRMNLNASESGDEKQSMRLNDIAFATLGEGKEESPPEVIEKFGNKPLGALSWDLWEAGGKWRDLLVRYNLRDTDLLRRIEKETGYIALFDTLCEVCNIFGDSAALNPTHQMDGFMLQLGLERGHHFASKKFFECTEKFKGAYVMHPLSVGGDKDWTDEDAAAWRKSRGMTNGILRNVHVCDFASLYPSIIITWNMSPETKRVMPADGTIPAGHCKCPLTGIGFTTEVQGILPAAVAELIRLRKHWTEVQMSFPPGTPEHQAAKRKSNAYKVAANSFYGVVGSPFSRFFDRQVAESVTQNGKWLIQITNKTAEEVDPAWCAVYGDTDSGMVIGCTRTEFAGFVEWCNTTLYPDILSTWGCVENRIKLAYEKAFDRLVFTSAKKYAGRYLHFKGKDATAESKPEIKGLEYKRGDALLLARDLQAQVIDLLVGGLKRTADNVPTPTEELTYYHDAITKVRTHVLADTLPLAEIRLVKAVQKPLKEYKEKIKKDGTKAAQPPHVAIAKQMKARGEEVGEGTRVEYIVTDGASSPHKVIPASEYTGSNADRFYIWEDLVFPPTQRLLEAAFPDHDWETWRKVRPAKIRESKKKPPALPSSAA